MDIEIKDCHSGRNCQGCSSNVARKTVIIGRYKKTEAELCGNCCKKLKEEL